MAAMDWKIIFNGHEYVARGYTFSSLFTSPLFENIDDYKKWFGFEPVFEHKAIVIKPINLENTKQALSKLLKGERPNGEEIASLRKVRRLNNWLVEYEEDKADIANKIAGQGLSESFKNKYSEDIHEVLCAFIDSYLGSGVVVNEGYLKIIGEFLSKEFENTGILEKPFKEVYEAKVKVSKEELPGGENKIL